jgi:polyphosphate kinase 2 (PPK2 family)
MKIHSKDFRVPHHKKIDIKRLPTIVKPFCESKKEYKDLLEKHIAELTSLQQLHYASNRYALLLIFQGMDSAGKDGAIRHVMSGVNPEGCEVFGFKQPSAEELEHDFLWRTTCRLPERGRIGIFNRSYYEEVLIVRVHPEILRTQRLPDGRGSSTKARRFFQRHLQAQSDKLSHVLSRRDKLQSSELRRRSYKTVLYGGNCFDR